MSARDLSRELLQQLGLDADAAEFVMIEIERLRQLLTQQAHTIEEMTTGIQPTKKQR